MPLSAAELIARGALRSAEGVIANLGANATSSAVLGALERRFGAENVDIIGAQDVFFRARQGVIAGERLQLGRQIDVESMALNPSQASRYSYTTVARLPDPFHPGQSVEIPFTVNSDVPLTPQEVANQSQEAVLEYTSQPERGDSGRRNDIVAKDARFLTARTGTDNPVELLEILIVSAYRKS